MATIDVLSRENRGGSAVSRNHFTAPEFQSSLNLFFLNKFRFGVFEVDPKQEKSISVLRCAEENTLDLLS